MSSSPIRHAMSTSVEAESRPTPRWRYLVPNAITCVGLLIGLTSVFKAMEGQYVEASWLIILCVLLDKLDGTTARLLRATSDIGVQLDSFSDFITFGIAPGVLVFLAVWRGDAAGGDVPHEAFAIWQGEAMGWLLRALISTYVLCAVLRLARFNVLTEVEGASKVFYGLPTTPCGAVVATMFIIMHEQEIWASMCWFPVLLAALGLLMVSDLPLPKVAVRESTVLNLIQGVNVVIAYLFGLLRIFPEYLLALLLVYAVVGFLWGFFNRNDLGPERLDPYPSS